ncbi:uncharacterized protein N7443_007253 [Penicillium atrosanguineum]|uniref:uncharacterized protein n=1 Tax=Penicillium atrosanguineum TaxID=1132637 RepID=UPI0023991D68|nr:uncharacterized protein N7443_007253 [Penicillium atrosanguineum]KAJ5296360.1 hypothetical protein N7443_007253 [Penicillium atrosanguineum]
MSNPKSATMWKFESLDSHPMGISTGPRMDTPSFNIARRRKPGEPDLASWDYEGVQDDYPPVDEVQGLLECAKKGCCVAVKQPKDEHENDSEDPDYVPQEETEDELEYNSEHESTDAMSLDGEEDYHDDENIDDADSYQDFLARTIIPQKKLRGEPVGNLAYSNNRNEIILPITSDELPRGYDMTELEHIPGVTCEEARAYSGYAISLQEMRCCRTAQFLVHKDASSEPWQPDGLHESWEISEDYFLSGQCVGMASRDCSDQDVSPVRGGVGTVHADNMNFGVPDLSVFLAGFDSGKTGKDTHGVKLDQDIKHTPVPSQPSGVGNLASLSLDVRLLLVDYLGPADITSLRIGSEAFATLPNGIWYRLVHEEMPWLWEAWNGPDSSHIPSSWTRVTANEVKVVFNEKKRYSSILGDGYGPADEIAGKLLTLSSGVPEQMKLSRENTDWHRLFTQIKRNWPKLKGLRNRKRIWEDVEAIIRRIVECEGQ